MPVNVHLSVSTVVLALSLFAGISWDGVKIATPLSFEPIFSLLRRDSERLRERLAVGAFRRPVSLAADRQHAALQTSRVSFVYALSPTQ